MSYSGQEYAQALEMHQSPLLELLAQIPEDKGTFAAWEGGKNFIQLTDHLKLTKLRMSAMIAGEKPGTAESSTDLASARAALQSASASLTVDWVHFRGHEVRFKIRTGEHHVKTNQNVHARI